MKNLRWIVPALAIALAAPGCVLTSGQFLIDFELDDFSTTNQSVVAREDVDLTTEEDYVDHKEDLQGLADVAVLGTLINNGGSTINAELYMTASPTAYTTSTEVKGNAIKLWGPFQVAAGASKTVDWNESASLFSAGGKELLINEIKGDGQFTVYMIAAETTYSFEVRNGVLALVLEFAK
ncbi:MAG TPA: hypothetical protein VFP58_05915 [Candidatus Eisenbacteria bacterium]|nr:hypothetical protein [Candidatus Eisenbacteria bacterium]